MPPAPPSLLSGIQDATVSSCVFPVPALELAMHSRSPDSFYWKTVLEPRSESGCIATILIVHVNSSEVVLLIYTPTLFAEFPIKFLLLGCLGGSIG